MDNSNDITSTLNYIENNLEEDMSLESLSKNMHFSKYHYHRMFLSDIGTSIMKYIRTRRIVRAAYQLELSEDSITDIALNLGFDGIDVFARAFKRFYGITPSEYRTVSKKNIYVQQEVLFMSETRVIEMVQQCTVEDKRQCLSMLDRIIGLSRKAHQNGLLSLENEVSVEDCVYLNKGLELLLVGTNPNSLKEMLTNYLNVGNYTPKEILERLIVLNGLLLIQAGEYPWQIRELVSSLFGEDFIEEISEHCGLNKELNILKIHKVSFTVDKPILEKEIKDMDIRSLQRLLREVDIILIAYALGGCSGGVKLKLISGLSKSNQRILFEMVELLSDITVAQIADSQNEILKIIKALRLSKDIK